VSDRHALLRRIYAEGTPVLADHAAEDFASVGAGTGPLRALFPGIRHEPLELVDADGDRVVARVRVSLGEGDATFEMVQVWRFRGDEICGVWSLHDALPWLQALGIVPGDEEIEQGLDEALVTRRRRSPPG
jgi:hypothetical protein